MKRFGVFALLVLIAMILAGVYGMVHDQISYTVSPEYFTKFKFRQFGLVDWDLPDRVRAAMVGFLASWWMGIPIGLLVGGMGFMHPGPRRMFKVTLESYWVLIIFTFLFGLGGLGFGWLQTRHLNPPGYHGWFIPDDVADLRRFLCAGYMHNSSYLGGILGIFVAFAFHVIVRIKQAMTGATENKARGGV